MLGKQFKIYGTPEEPMFQAKDVAEWIEHSNVSKMLNTIDEEEKTTITLSYNGNMTTNQLFLTEDGFYEVLMQSRKPIAKQFKKEVKVILKSIRTSGGYLSPKIDFADPNNIRRILDNWEEDRRLRLVAEAETKRIEAEFIQSEAIIEKQKPAVEYFETSMGVDDTVSLGETAKIISDRSGIHIGRNNMNKLLKKRKIFLEDGTPAQSQMGTHRFKVVCPIKRFNSKDNAIPTTRVYPKGIDFIFRLVKDELQLEKN